jgi:EmrB/QacA subfamily drug resistance transporter
MVAMTSAMLTTPWLLSRFGYRRTYEICMWLLLLGGIGGGLAEDYNWVLVARVVEGVAAGVVQPIPVIIIMNAFAPEERGRASGLFATGVVLAPAIGPSVGGLLVDALGWRSIFFMVVPLALAALVLARRYVPTTAPGGVPANEASGRLDWLGLLLALVGTVLLLNGMVGWREQGAAQGLPLLLFAALTAASFVAWQRRLQRRFTHHATGAQPPLMDLRVFTHRSFVMGSLVSVIYGTALFGSTYLVPVFMQIGLGLSASYVGTALLPAGLVLAVTINVVGRWADRTDKRRLVLVGLVLLAGSFALMSTVDPERGLLTLWLWTILGRMGLGFILPSLNLGSMQGMPPTLIPQGASVVNFLRMLGGAVGVSLCAIVLEWRLSDLGLADLAAGDPHTRLLAFHHTFWFLAVVTALAIIPAWWMSAPVHKKD